MNLEFIIFAGCIQGVIVSIVHLLSSKNSQGRYLSLFILALSLQLLLQSRGFLLTIGSLGFPVAFMDSIVFLISPLFYFYIFITFFRSIRPKISIFVHLIPFVIGVVTHLTVYLISGSHIFYKLFTQTLEGNPPIYINILLIFKLLSGTIYSFLIVRLFIAFKDELSRSWFYIIPGLFITTWVGILILALVIDSIFIKYLYQVILFMVFIYVITIYSRLKPEIFSYTLIRKKIKTTLGIGDNHIKSIINAVYKEMESKIYLDSDLTLYKLSKRIGIHENQISFAINDQTGKNFTSFTNSFRVEYFIELALSERIESETILSLALESGFSSKSTFNRVFKDIKGQTPSFYLKEKVK